MGATEEREIEILPLFYDHILTQCYPINILVGGRATGKSFFMEQLAGGNMNNKRKYKFMVIEDVETNIGEGVKAGILNRIEEFGHDSIYKDTKQPPTIVNKVNKNNTIFKGYHSDAQQKQVKSLNEVTAAWYEEAENITYKQFKALRMQLRGGDPEDRQLFLTLNPINSNSFINQYFFQQAPDKVIEYFSDGRPKVFVKNIVVEMEKEVEAPIMGGERQIGVSITKEIIEVVIECMVVVSTHWDNPYLTAEQRADIEEMKLTDPDMYAMLAEGKFVKPAGTYATNVRRHSGTLATIQIHGLRTRYMQCRLVGHRRRGPIIPLQGTS